MSHPTVLVVPTTTQGHVMTERFGVCHCDACGFVFYIPQTWKTARQQHQDCLWCPAGGHRLRFRSELEDKAEHAPMQTPQAANDGENGGGGTSSLVAKK